MSGPEVLGFIVMVTVIAFLVGFVAGEIHEGSRRDVDDLLRQASDDARAAYGRRRLR